MRPGLWRDFHLAASRHGHSWPAYRATLAMAERAHETADWLALAGMPLTMSSSSASGTGATRSFSYMQYSNGARTHLSLNKDVPVPRIVQAIGRILPTPILGGLHHQYVWIWFPTGTGGRTPLLW
jgi:hypothetical protein